MRLDRMCRMPSISLPQPANADDAMDAPLLRMGVVAGDIATLPPEFGVDALVNAANESLLGGGGVDGAIHRAAGSQLMDFNRTLGGCPTGGVKVSPAFDLEARGIRHILHAVGPVWHGIRDTGVPGAPGDETAQLGYTLEDNMLASCHARALEMAALLGVRHLAIPAISTGAFRFPKERAAKIAFGHVHGHLLRATLPERVTFVFLAQADADLFSRVAQNRRAWMGSPRR